MTSKLLTCKADWIKENSIRIFEYITESKESGGLGYSDKDVIIFGRSIGTGPAIMLASIYNPYMLICLSPFTSIQNVIASFLGEFLSYFIFEHFDNLEAIRDVTCPTIFLHGEKDNLISV